MIKQERRTEVYKLDARNILAIEINKDVIRFDIGMDYSGIRKNVKYFGKFLYELS